MIKNVKSILLLLAIAGGGGVFSQVGVNTDSPDATLDVRGIAEDPTVVDGVIPPRITKSQLTDKTGYGTPQTGTLVYITDPTGPVNPSTTKISESGLHVFDGTIWTKTKNEVVTDTSGSEVKKIQTAGQINPLQTVVNGIFEFRMNATGSAMLLQLRIIPSFTVTSNITLARSSLWNIGSGDPTGGLGTLTFTPANTDQWQTISSIAFTNGYSQMIYLSAFGDDITTPVFYVMFTQKIGDNQATGAGLKSFIINRY